MCWPKWGGRPAAELLSANCCAELAAGRRASWYRIRLERGCFVPRWNLAKSATEAAVKKLKHENELFKAALLAGVKYAEGRGVVEFEPTDSASEKLLYIYRLLVHDKVIQPLPEDQVAEKTLRHKLAIWYSKQLPKDHPLLN
jgi:hypothetical protein